MKLNLNEMKRWLGNPGTGLSLMDISFTARLTAYVLSKWKILCKVFWNIVHAVSNIRRAYIEITKAAKTF